MEEIEESMAQSDKATGTLQKIGNTIAQMAKALIRILKVAIKLVGKFIKWLVTFIASNFWIFLIVAVIVIIAVVVVAIVSYFSSGGYDKDKGTMSSVSGVMGDKFYGTRFLYYDNELTSLDLQNTYLEFTYNLLYDIESASNGTIVNIDFTKPYNENTSINEITTTYACALAKTSGSLLECTTVINNYGFSEELKDGETRTQKETVLETLATTLSTGKAYTPNSYDEILNKIKDSYDKESFAYMKNVCAKILIKDYILEADKTATDIPKKNYVGFVYMPKQDVVMEETSFVFLVDDGKTVDITANYLSSTTDDELDTATADSSWFSGGMADKLLTCELNDYILTTFTAIDSNDLNYLSEEKTIFKIMRDNKFSTYFKDSANVESSESLLENVNTNNYFYLSLNSDSAYNMAEAFVTYE